MTGAHDASAINAAGAGVLGAQYFLVETAGMRWTTALRTRVLR